MFSKKMVMIVGLIVLIVVNIIALSLSSRRHFSSSYYGPGGIGISLIAPFQKIVTRSIGFAKDIWNHYFFLVIAAQQNDIYRKTLSKAKENNNHYKELEFSNIRLRNLLNFQKTMTKQVLAAEVIGKDPSPWFKTVIIDKGSNDGVENGMAVVIPEGIAGQVTGASPRYSKVLLIIDYHSAVDALVQKTRARGIIKGWAEGQCFFKYVLRKHDVTVGDRVVSSGLDGVFPKGLAVGRVASVVRPSSGIFQEITVTPFVDFETLEEVFVVLSSKNRKFQDE